MTFWFVPSGFTMADEQQVTAHTELAISATSIPDLSRACERDQSAVWHKQHLVDKASGRTADQRHRDWRLGHEILPGDFVVIVDATKSALIVGEVVGEYQYETRTEGAFHVLPVDWQNRKISLVSVPGFVMDLVQGSISKIEQEDTLEQLKKCIPSFRRRRQKIFKWITIIVLVSELFYFWPH